MKLKLFSPAKVNLFLRVMSRREDGYHNLASLFQAVSFGDMLEVELSTQDELVCNDPSIPRGRSNLIIKAVHLFRKKTGFRFHVKVKLDKKVPAQAGLGGGSSNGATILWGLNHLFQNPFSENELQAMGAEIGSDLPFFFSSGTAFCTGRGESVHSLSPFEGSGWIIKPNEGLSTKAVFAKLCMQGCSLEEPLKLLNSFYTSCPRYHNDLEKPAFETLPILKEIKEMLIQQGRPAVLTGSGTAFFCLGNKELPSELSLYHKVQKVSFIQKTCGGWYLPLL